MYQITDGHESIKIEEREEAIQEARDLSEGNHNTITVEDNVERLVYRNGDLMQYLYDTRRR